MYTSPFVNLKKNLNTDLLKINQVFLTCSHLKLNLPEFPQANPIGLTILFPTYNPVIS